MPAVFDTFGPFKLPPSDVSDTRAKTLRKFWEEIDEKSGKKLSTAMGVYIVVTQKRSGSLLPWYVGLTDRFRRRFYQHSAPAAIFSQIRQEAESDDLYIFLLARMTASGAVKTSGKLPRSIEELEFMLVRSCLLANKALLNKSNKIFLEGLIVPGFANDKLSQRSESAKVFAKMLLKNN